MAVDESPSAHYAVEWALSNLVRPDKDEMYLISVIVTPKKEPVCCRCSHQLSYKCADDCKVAARHDSLLHRCNAYGNAVANTFITRTENKVFRK
jgi:hypothetical protein